MIGICARIEFFCVQGYVHVSLISEMLQYFCVGMLLP